jgi:hypothetical protein
MKLFLVSLAVYVSFLIPDLPVVREEYKKAVSSEKVAYRLKDELKAITKDDDKRWVAYKGAVTALTARYQKDSKLRGKTFKEGVELIEYAVQKDSSDIEIRFVRLSVQQNSPKFLKYNKHIAGDKQFILSNFGEIQSEGLKEYLRSYILNSGKFSKQEKELILRKKFLVRIVVCNQ